MRFLLTAIFLLNTSTAMADEAIYDGYMSQNIDAAFCTAIGDELEDNYLEEMIEAVGEDMSSPCYGYKASKIGYNI